MGYFTQGRDLSHRPMLLDLVVEAGLVRRKAEAMLKGHDGLEAIREAEGLSRRQHVTGVPFFIINGQIMLAGAQAPEAFLAAFGQVEGATIRNP